MRRPIRPFVTEYKSRSPKPAPREAEPADLEPRPRFLEPPAPAPRARDEGHDDGYEAAMRAADLIFGKKTAPLPVAPAARKPEPRAAFAEAEALFTPELEPAIAAPPPTPSVSAPEATPSAPAAGRILPSLIETELAPRRAEEEARPARKRGRPRKTPLEPQKADAPAADSSEAPAPVEPARRAPTRRRAERPVVAPPPTFMLDVEEDDEAPTDEPLAMDGADEDAGEQPAAERRTRRPIQARWVRRTELAAGEKWKRRLPDSLRSR
jgi:hypothetical protein